MGGARQRAASAALRRGRRETARPVILCQLIARGQDKKRRKKRLAPPARPPGARQTYKQLLGRPPNDRRVTELIELPPISSRRRLRSTGGSADHQARRPPPCSLGVTNYTSGMSK